MNVDVLAPKVAMIPLTQVTVVDQALRTIDHIPYPEQLYLEVCGLLFRDEGNLGRTRAAISPANRRCLEFIELGAVKPQVKSIPDAPVAVARADPDRGRRSG
jgi:hypothetical protein